MTVQENISAYLMEHGVLKNADADKCARDICLLFAPAIAEVVAENDKLRERVKHLESDKGWKSPEEYAQLEAVCAAMREFIASTPHKSKCHLQQDRPFSEQRRKEFDARGCDCGRDHALSTDAGKSLLERLQAAEFKLKTYAMFRLRCDKCGDLFNDHHQGDSCPGAFYKNCEGTLQFNLPEAVSDRLQAVEKQAKEDKEYIEDLCAQLCKMEDALGFKNDYTDKDGAFVPTIGPWLERVRDLIASEGELGDVKDRLQALENQLAVAENLLLNAAPNPKFLTMGFQEKWSNEFGKWWAIRKADQTLQPAQKEQQ